MINSTRCAFMAKQACATFSQVVRKITPPHANNLLKFFFALFATLTLNAATAWAEEEVTLWDKNNPYVASDTEKTSSDGVVKWKNSASNTYSAPTRIYKNNVLTITASYKIVKVQFVCAASDTKDNGPGHFSSNVGTYSYSGTLGTWTGEANSIQFTASGGQVRIHSVTVTYESTGGDDPDEPGTGGDSDCVWQLVSDASTLAVGDEIIIAAADYNYALSTNQKSNNRGQTSITKKGDNISEISSDVQIITLETGNVANTFAFNTGNAGYLYAVSSSSNYLRTKTTLDNNGSWKITITDDGTSVAASGTNTCNQLNYNQSSSLFSCYPSDKLQKPIVLYKKVCAVAQTYSVKKGTLENCTLKFGKTEDNFTNDELTGLAEKDYVYFTITPSSGYELKGEPVIKDASDNNVECVEEDGVWMFEMPASDVTVSVSCVLTVKIYEVTFNANGHGTAPTAQNVEENTNATEPNPAPSATGYTFIGWYTDQACSDDKKFDFNTPITSDITLYAKWTINQYTVTLNPNYPEGQTGTFTDKDGNSVDKVELKYNYNTASMNLTDLYGEIELEGYQFNGWYNATSGGSKWTSTGIITKNVTLYAQWSKLYTVTLSENGTTKELTPQTATSYTLPTDLSVGGSCQDDTKEFVGWTTTQDLSSETTPTSDFYEKGATVTLSEDKTTFYAVFATPKTISGGTEEKEVVTTLDFSDQGYDNQQEVTSLTIGEVIVTFNKGSNNNAPKYYNTGTAVRVYGGGYFTVSSKNITKIAITTSTGEDSNAISADCGTYDTNNKTWTGSAQSVKFTVGGTTGHRRIKSVKVTYTTTVQADDIVTYSNYSTTCVPTYEITYDYAGGEGECTTDIVEKDTEYTLCATIPTKAGHTFFNWKDQRGGDYAVGATISVTEDLTLTAQWQVNSYEVTWMSLGSKLSYSSDVNYNTQPTQPTTNPTYLCGTDKEFVGWTTQEIDGVGTPANLYTNDFPIVTANVTYHAVFATKSEDGGSLAKATSLTNGETVYLATESGIGVIGANTETNKDATVSTTQSDWMAFTVVANGEQYQFKNGDNYITADAKTFKITTTPSDFVFINDGYVVYNVPSGSDEGDYVLLYNSNSGSFYRFYKISNMGTKNYETFYIYKSNLTHTDYVTSCEEVGSDMSNSTKVTPSVESGIFSVGEGKYVQFSTGNLQYEVGTNTWSFASEQYEVIGGEAYTGSNNTNYGMNVPGYTGKLDLFAWSSDGKFGVNPSNTDADYGEAASDFVDWGNRVDGEDNWYTLTKDEMNYILARTKNGTKLWALATINDLVGLILLPDNWDTNINLAYGYIPEKFVYAKNLLSIAEWQTLEEAGAVFLPAGGLRTGGYGNTDKAGGKGTIDANGHYFHVDNVNIYGYYWLNTQDPRDTHKNCASYLILPGWDEGPTVDEEGLDDLSTRPQVWSREKRRGNSVRLVKEVPACTVSVTAENGTVTGAGTYPQGAEVTLTATPNFDYKFVNWTEEGVEVSTNTTYTFTATRDVELVANFKATTITLTDGDNRTEIAANIGNTVDVVIKRSFIAGDGYYTLCVPFNIAASEIGTAYQLGEITEHVSGEKGGININLTEVEHIEAGKPYLVLPKTLENPVFENVTIVDTEGSNYTVTGAGVEVTFTGIINGGGDTNGSTDYYVGNNGYLYKGTVAKLGLRAFFTITDATGNPTQIRARVVTNENVETGVEDIITTDAPVKVIENGQLIIIRGGVKYNVQGQKL